MKAPEELASEKVPAEDEYDHRFNRFQQILDAEHEIINRRRRQLGRLAPAWPQIDSSKPGGARRPIYIASGVALSGGGIRSAAFCLGAMQSLAVARPHADPVGKSSNTLFDHLDYLSTVSGGGYVGSAISAAMAKPTSQSQTFPFASVDKFDDNSAVRHLRDFSNYLLPRGRKSVGKATAIILRGLMTNLVFVSAGLFLFAALAVWAYPDMDTLRNHGSFVPSLLKVEARPLLLPAIGALVLGAYLLLWAIGRSWPNLCPKKLRPGLLSDVHGGVLGTGRLLTLIVFWLALFDLTPFVLHGFIWLNRNISADGLWRAIIAGSGSVAAAIGFFSSRLSAVLKSNSFKSGPGALAKRISVYVLAWFGAAVLPLLLWIAYLWISAIAITYSNMCVWTFCGRLQPAPTAAITYAALFLASFLLAHAFKANANSLHQIYRDRLSKAFLFDPNWRTEVGDYSEDLLSRSDTKLSEISPSTGGPYHLINAAINLQGSVQANRRGRNASIFLFSSQFVGSDITSYVATSVVEQTHPRLDLGAAMAISGAAVSPDMGSQSIAALAPTLALLNLRLGYWMINPDRLRKGQTKLTLWEWVRNNLVFSYIWKEMRGRLDETHPMVYLTDGGHIENLGLYSLLQRHCSVIIVVDSECAPTLSFHALSTCQRYARIDLGVRIDLPWQEIADVGNAATRKAQNGTPIEPKGGPHCAVGSIFYPGGEKGVLVYVKSSLTGDEPDYVVDYKMRYPAFPHETTGDQFFSEEQFEAYRALGFHALSGFLSGTRTFTCCDEIAAAAKGAGCTVPDYVKSLFQP